METIGKILSLTLITIFGSAAATVYLVDSSFLPSLFNEAPVTYTSDENYYLDETQVAKIADYRRSQKGKYLEVKKDEGSPPVQTESKVWGHSYEVYSGSGESSYETARELAELNSLSSLTKSMSYWSEQYQLAVKAGDSTRADSSLKKYSTYKKAVQIKKDSRSN